MADGKRALSGMVSSQNGVYWSYQEPLWHAIALKPCYCVAGLEIVALGTQLHRFPRNCVDPIHFQTSNFIWLYLSRPNFDSHVLRLYGKIFESRI